MKNNLNRKPYVSEEGQTFIHDKSNEEYAIERLRKQIDDILSKHNTSSLDEDLQEVFKLQSCILELQSIVNKQHGIAYINKFGGDSYSKEHLQMMNSIYDELNNSIGKSR